MCKERRKKNIDKAGQYKRNEKVKKANTFINKADLDTRNGIPFIKGCERAFLNLFSLLASACTQKFRDWIKRLQCFPLLFYKIYFVFILCIKWLWNSVLASDSLKANTSHCIILYYIFHQQILFLSVDKDYMLKSHGSFRWQSSFQTGWFKKKSQKSQQ